jgi:hypothetical protein
MDKIWKSSSVIGSFAQFPDASGYFVLRQEVVENNI